MRQIQTSGESHTSIMDLLGKTVSLLTDGAEELDNTVKTNEKSRKIYAWNTEGFWNTTDHEHKRRKRLPYQRHRMHSQ